MLIADIQEIAEKGYEIVLSDGKYCLKSEIISFKALNNKTNESLLFDLLQKKKLYTGMKIHVIGASATLNIVKTNNEQSYFSIAKNYKISLNYNGISRACNNEKLGIQHKGWIYKSIISTSPYGGKVFMIDGVITKIENQNSEKYNIQVIDSLQKISDKKKGEAKITFLSNPKLEQGIRYKFFNLMPDIQCSDSSILPLFANEHSKVMECKSNHINIRKLVDELRHNDSNQTNELNLTFPAIFVNQNNENSYFLCLHNIIVEIIGLTNLSAKKDTIVIVQNVEFMKIIEYNQQQDSYTIIGNPKDIPLKVTEAINNSNKIKNSHMIFQMKAKATSIINTWRKTEEEEESKIIVKQQKNTREIQAKEFAIHKIAQIKHK